MQLGSLTRTTQAKATQFSAMLMEKCNVWSNNRQRGVYTQRIDLIHTDIDP